jgi:hypothetical protein
MVNWKVWGERDLFVLRYYPGICQEVLRKTQETFSQFSGFIDYAVMFGT